MTVYLWALVGAIVGMCALPAGRYLLQRAGRGAATGTGSASGPPRPAGRLAPLRSRPTTRSARMPRQKAYRAISIQPGNKPCPAAEELAGRRFLGVDAPQLPLQGCDRTVCKCTYGHHTDRRLPEERRTAWGTYGGFAPAVAGGNRRQKHSERRRR